MPFTVFSDPPLESSPPKSENRTKARAPLRPVLATITPTSSPSAGSARRPPLGDKGVPDLGSKAVEETRPRFPTAKIDADGIGSIMASRLITCVLGFVLFLKSQIPFPVAQLVKMHSLGSDNAPPNRKLDSFVTSFDVLSSHLTSTFTALSVAFAKTRRHNNRKANLVKSHIAIILGPSPTSMAAARARIVVELDSLRVSRVSIPETGTARAGAVPNECLKENAHAGGSQTRRSFESCEPLREHRGLASQQITPADLSNMEDREQPSTDAEGPPCSDSEESELDLDEEEILSEDDESSVAGNDTEAHFCLAERNISRALTMANSDPELGMAADIRPTCTHIFLRAPRRFSHPAWVPRQGASRDMDLLLHQFDVTAGADGPASSTSARIKGQAGIKTDYVRIQAVGTIDSVSGEEEDPEHGSMNVEDGDESEDEMIWWSWDGTLEGFTEI